jgi:hypothetical protein
VPIKKTLETIGESLAALGAVAAIAFFLWGFYLSLKIVGDLGGFWATIAGGLLSPIVFLITPWHAGFALGDWFPLWISYVAFWAAACTAAAGARLRLKMSRQGPATLAEASNGSPSEGPKL